jgi:tetratricopeptide (TPR) repeat protein
LIPGLAQAWVVRATADLAREDLASAAEAFDRAFALGVSSLALHINRSAIAVNVGQMDVALVHAEAAAACDSSSLVAQINAAMIEGPTRGYKAALARLDGAASIAPNDASLNRARAATLIQLKRFEPALAVAEQAVTGDPEEPLGYELRLTALRALGRNAKALALFDDPAALALGAPRLIVHLAALKMERGERKGARELLRAALARDPGLVSAWFHLGEIADFDTEGADIAAMERLLERRTSTVFDRIQLHFALGQAYLVRDDYTRAIAHLEQGNVAKRGRGFTTYDEVRDERLVADVARDFSAGVLAAGRSKRQSLGATDFSAGHNSFGTVVRRATVGIAFGGVRGGRLPAMTQSAAQAIRSVATRDHCSS